MMTDPTTQPIANRLRVLVVENDKSSRESYDLLLNKWEYQPFLVEGEGIELQENAKKMVGAHRCHLALVDMRLMDDSDREDFSGIELAKELQPALTIIVSGYPDYKVVREGLKHEYIYDFLGKAEGPEKWKSVLDKAALHTCASWRKLVIQPAGIAHQIMKDIYPDHDQTAEDEVAEVLSRLFPKAKRLEIKKIERAEKPDLTSAPRPRSKIISVYPDDLQPVIVKLARAKKITKEVERYQNYIENRLVGNLSPRMDRSECFWNVGGIVYPFMGSKEVQLFSTYYETADVEDIEYSITQLFEQTWSSLYASPNNAEKPLFEAYCQVWDRNWFDERVKNFESLAPQENMPPKWQIISAPEPISWLIEKVSLSNEIPQTRLRVTHGDMHGDNLLVDNQRNVWLIDFERSGDGPILQDFTELEADIVTRLVGLPDFDFTSLYQLGIWIAKPSKISEYSFFPSSASAHLRKAMKVIVTLRQLAHKCTGESDSRAYLWGLLLNAIFRASMINKQQKPLSIMRALMLASILCHRLDHMDESWPPDDWPNIF